MSSFVPYLQGLIPVLLSFAFWRAKDCHICLPVEILRLWVSLLLMDQTEQPDTQHNNAQHIWLKMFVCSSA